MNKKKIKVLIYEGFPSKEEALKWYKEQKKKYKTMEDNFEKLMKDIEKYVKKKVTQVVEYSEYFF